MNISPARIAAFDILLRIETERCFSSILLPEYESRLSPKDRALCHQLTLGVLRKQIYLDRVVDHFGCGKRLDPAVRISLRLGLYQLLFLDRVPDHSAVNESVNLVQKAKKTSARGFVNAILRRALREPFVPKYTDEVDKISVETSHPRWLIEKWIQRFGISETAMLAESNNAPPIAAFRLTARAPDGLRFEGAQESEFVPGCFLADPGTAEMAQAAERSEIYFQDEGSQLVGNAVVVPDGGLFLDVCAAPGSKLTQIAAQRNDGLIVGGDIHSHRTRFLLENAWTQSVSRVSVVQYDAENEFPFEEGSFDTVLVDAPCSGTGTIRHNPEIRYFLESDDITALSAKQRRILRNASKMVRNGGYLIYSTCSLEGEENEAIADDFLRSHPAFRKTAIDVPGRFVLDDHYARTMPHIDQMDGFFIASFVRSEPPAVAGG
jgi:16S rRNA (cytosine967-C5)-methyltransferase